MNRVDVRSPCIEALRIRLKRGRGGAKFVRFKVGSPSF